MMTVMMMMMMMVMMVMMIVPIGSIVVPFGGLYLGSYKGIPQTELQCSLYMGNEEEEKEDFELSVLGIGGV